MRVSDSPALPLFLLLVGLPFPAKADESPTQPTHHEHGEPRSEASGPNVVLFLVDDMGYVDSSTYGSGYYETPSLDRLASQGMRFTNAYAASPTARPATTSPTPTARLACRGWETGRPPPAST